MNDHPIDPFLAAWSAAAGIDGVASRLRIYRALQLSGQWNRARLRSVLGALLVPTPELLPIFTSLFDAWFDDDGMDQRLDGIDVQDALMLLVACAQSRGERTKIGRVPSSLEAPRQARATRKNAFAGVLVLLLALAAFLSVFGYDHSKSRHDSDGAEQGGDEGPKVADTVSPESRVPEALASYRLAVDSRIEPKPDWNLRLLALAFVLLSFAGLVEVWQHVRRRRFRTPPVQPLRIETALELQYPDSSKPRPFATAELDRLAFQTGLARDSEFARLNVRKTVRRTTDMGGLVTAVYEPRKQTRGVSVVLPTELDEITAVVVEAFVDGMRQRGVPIHVTSGAPRWDTEDLVLVLVDARSQEDPPVGRWLTMPHLALVEVRDPELWAAEVSTLPRRAHGLDAIGLYTALEVAVSGRSPRPIDQRAVTRAIDVLDIAQLGDAWPMAAACSLISPCDLATADEMRRELLPTVPFLAFQRVRSLRGVTADATGWRFSVALSRTLQRDAGADFTMKILDWQSKRLAAIACPPGSRAEATLLRERTVVALKQRLLSVNAAVSTASEPLLLELVHELERLGGDEVLKRRVQERLTAFPSSWLKSPRIPTVITWRMFRLSQHEDHRPAARDPSTRPKMLWLFDAPIILGALLCVGMAVPPALEEALISGGLEPGSPIKGVWLTLSGENGFLNDDRAETVEGGASVVYASQGFPGIGEEFDRLKGLSGQDRQVRIVAFFDGAPPATAMQAWRQDERVHLRFSAVEASPPDERWNCRQSTRPRQVVASQAGVQSSDELLAALVSLPRSARFDQVAADILRLEVADCVTREVEASLPDAGVRGVVSMPPQNAKNPKVLHHRIADAIEPNAVISELVELGFSSPRQVENLPVPEEELPLPAPSIAPKSNRRELGAGVRRPERPARVAKVAVNVPDVPIREDDCRARYHCTDKGRCTWQDGACKATSDADCRKSYGCSLRGECSARAGFCRAASAADCRRVCTEYGMCTFENGACVATLEDCRKSKGCRVDGACTNSPTRNYCLAASDEDCAGSTNCTKFGKCRQSYNTCDK